MGTRRGRGVRAGSATQFRYYALGLQVVLTFLVCVWGGHWLGQKFDLGPWGILGGVVLGLIAMFVSLLREGRAGVSGSSAREDGQDGSSGEKSEG